MQEKKALSSRQPGDHTQSVVTVWLCITLYQRVSPWCCVGVGASLGDGCVSGPHPPVHGTQCLCWADCIRVWGHGVFAYYPVYVVFVWPLVLECIMCVVGARTEPRSPRQARRCPGRSCRRRSGAGRCRARGGRCRRPAGSRCHGARPVGAGGAQRWRPPASQHLPPSRGKRPGPGLSGPGLRQVCRVPHCPGGCCFQAGSFDQSLAPSLGLGGGACSRVTPGLNALPASLRLPAAHSGARAQSRLHQGLRAGGRPWTPGVPGPERGAKPHEWVAGGHCVSCGLQTNRGFQPRNC